MEVEYKDLRNSEQYKQYEQLRKKANITRRDIEKYIQLYNTDNSQIKSEKFRSMTYLRKIFDKYQINLQRLREINQFQQEKPENRDLSDLEYTFWQVLLENYRNKSQDKNDDSFLASQDMKNMTFTMHSLRYQIYYEKFDVSGLKELFDLLETKRGYDQERIKLLIYNEKRSQDKIHKKDMILQQFISMIAVFGTEGQYDRIIKSIEKHEHRDDLKFMINNHWELMVRRDLDIDLDYICSINPALVVHFHLKYRSNTYYKEFIQKLLRTMRIWLKIYLNIPEFKNYVVDMDRFEYKEESIDEMFELENSRDNHRIPQSSNYLLLENLKKVSKISTKLVDSYIGQIREIGHKKSIVNIYDQYRQYFEPDYLKGLQRDNMGILPLDDKRVQMQTLQEFNMILYRRSYKYLQNRVDINKNDREKLYQTLLELFFNYIKRREDIQESLFDPLKHKLDKISRNFSLKFLITYILQNSNNELKQLLLHYLLSIQYIPLISNKMVLGQENTLISNKMVLGQENTLSNKVMYPQLLDVMDEGYGIYNLGLGFCRYKMGKSHFLKQVVFPVQQHFYNNFVCTDDNSYFNGSTVDVFFEKVFQNKRNIAVIDGQGDQYHLIKHISELTNIMILHLDYMQLKDKKDRELEDQLKYLFKIVGEYKESSIKVIVVIRDSNQNKVLIDKKQREFVYNEFPVLEMFYDQIDYAVQIPMLNYQLSDKDLGREKVCDFINRLIYRLNSDEQSKMKFNHQNVANMMKNFNQGKNKEVNELVEGMMNIINNALDYQYDAREPVCAQQRMGLEILKLMNDVNETKQKLMIELDQSMHDNKLQRQKAVDQSIRAIQQKKEVTTIMKHFIKIAKSSQYQMITYVLKYKLSKFCVEKTAALKKELSKQKKEFDQIEEETRIEHTKKKGYDPREVQRKVEEKTSENKKVIDNIKQELQQREISLEMLKRVLFKLIDYNLVDQSLISNEDKENIYKVQQQQCLKGDSQELINGDNLELNSILVYQIFKDLKLDQKYVLTIIVIGRQSSGKSTLLNFCLGTQFHTSQGRCTTGIYFTLQKLPETMKVNGKWISHILILDTEGLQNPNRTNDQFDKKIVTFAFQNANIVICNIGGDYDKQIKMLLEVCTYFYNRLRFTKKNPQVYFMFNQNADISKQTYHQLIQTSYQDIFKVLGQIDNSLNIMNISIYRIFLLGFMYQNNYIRQKKYNNPDLIINTISTKFSIDCSAFIRYVLKDIEDPKDTEDQEDIEDQKEGYRRTKDRELLDIKTPLQWLDDALISWQNLNNSSEKIMRYQGLKDIQIQDTLDALLEKLRTEFCGYLKKRSDEFDKIEVVNSESTFSGMSQKISKENTSMERNVDNYLCSKVFTLIQPFLEEKKMTDMRQKLVEDQRNKIQNISNLFTHNYHLILNVKALEQLKTCVQQVIVNEFKFQIKQGDKENKYVQKFEQNSDQFGELLNEFFNKNWNSMIDNIRQKQERKKIQEKQYIYLFDFFSFRMNLPIFDLEIEELITGTEELPNIHDLIKRQEIHQSKELYDYQISFTPNLEQKKKYEEIPKQLYIDHEKIKKNIDAYELICRDNSDLEDFFEYKKKVSQVVIDSVNWSQFFDKVFGDISQNLKENQQNNQNKSFMCFKICGELSHQQLETDIYQGIIKKEIENLEKSVTDIFGLKFNISFSSKMLYCCMIHILREINKKVINDFENLIIELESEKEGCIDILQNSYQQIMQTRIKDLKNQVRTRKKK